MKSTIHKATRCAALAASLLLISSTRNLFYRRHAADR